MFAIFIEFFLKLFGIIKGLFILFFLIDFSSIKYARDKIERSFQNSKDIFIVSQRDR